MYPSEKSNLHRQNSWNLERTDQPVLASNKVLPGRGVIRFPSPATKDPLSQDAVGNRTGVERTTREPMFSGVRVSMHHEEAKDGIGNRRKRSYLLVGRRLSSSERKDHVDEEEIRFGLS